jgi:hypothetical protein
MTCDGLDPVLMFRHLTRERKDAAASGAIGDLVKFENQGPQQDFPLS